MESKYRKIQGFLMRNGRIHRRIVEGRIGSLGIHSSQHVMLMHLNRLGRMASQMQLAAMLDVSPASVARTLKSLEQGGYIERFGASADSRRNEICITEKGKAVCRYSVGIFDEIDRMSYADFTEAELDQLAALLGKMQNNLVGIERQDKERQDSEKQDKEKTDKGSMCCAEREMKSI